MAIEINEALLAAVRKPSNWRGILRHKTRRCINASRSLRRATPLQRFGLDQLTIELTGTEISYEFESQRDLFKQQGFAFIPNFFRKDLYEKVLLAWPKLAYFEMRADPSKSYDRGIDAILHPRGTGLVGIHSDFYLAFLALASRSFEQRVGDFCSDGLQRYNSSLAASWARAGSHLLPHMDNASRHGSSAVVNFVVFIDGTQPPFWSGGTSIFRTNTFDEPIMIPPTLKNSALVYETGQKFFHGFPRLASGKFSKRLIAQYSPKGTV
jgi:hypothetical protein